MQITSKFLSGLLVIAVASCSGSPTVVQDDGIVRVIHEPPSALNIHGYGDTIIEINGSKYHHVWTGNAYYVRLPERNLILFVTSMGGAGTGTTQIHVVDLDSGQHVESKPSDIWFGIGLGNSKESKVTDYVESVQANTLILVSRAPQGFYRYKMDLKSGALEKLQ